ncbi:hypothetical protein [Nitrosomonas aestuarii]|uniref:hypothetical protein n=1 Tax=Nitrosomonas aestuarii TaxID=52441 RepID=UPI000D42B71E|nr:hypothetical protein [Nitrosomonas aestuarii]PTN12162.1 hypothetical protein C8R11_105124 [Nitrosomonas aestuarii]
MNEPMDPAEKKRKTIIGAALIVTLIAVVLVEDEAEITVDQAQPVTTQKSTRSSPRDTNRQEIKNEYLDVAQLGQRTFDPQAGELFAATSWAPKRPPVSAQQQAIMAQQQRAKAKIKAAPPAPTPPPLQFKYIGKAIEGNRTWVFLTQENENYIARIGENIDEQYRLDAINNESVTVTYLPLNAKQVLPINDKQAGNFR